MPFGRPVLPELYIQNAISSREVSTGCKVDENPANQLWPSSSFTGTLGASWGVAPEVDQRMKRGSRIG